MDPITIMAATAVVSGLVQLYNSEKARGASKDQLKKIEDQFNQIKPPDYDLTIDQPPQLHQQFLQSPQFAEAVASPQFDQSKLSPENLKSVGEFIPELAPLVKEIAPTTIQDTADMKYGRQAQLDALKKFMQVGEGGFDPEYEQKVQQAARAAQTEAQGRQGALMDTFARRGLGGSGLELAAQLGSNAQAMDRLAAQNQQAATDSYRNQLQALAQGAGLGSDIRAQDQSLQAQNASIINSFNQRMSQQQQAWEQNRANALNEAQVRNLAEKQRISDANAGTANQFALNQQARGDDLAKYGYGARVDAQKRQDALAQQTYQNTVNERNAQNAIAQSLADWNANQRKYANQLKGQQFQDQMGIAAGKSGAYQANAQNILGSAQDRNQAIGGATNAAILASMYSPPKGAATTTPNQPSGQNANVFDEDPYGVKYGR